MENIRERQSSINMPDTVVNIWLDAGTQNFLFNSWKITKYPPVTSVIGKASVQKLRYLVSYTTWKVPNLDLVLHFLHPSDFIAFNSEEGLLLAIYCLLTTFSLSVKLQSTGEVLAQLVFPDGSGC